MDCHCCVLEVMLVFAAVSVVKASRNVERMRRTSANAMRTHESCFLITNLPYNFDFTQSRNLLARIKSRLASLSFVSFSVYPNSPLFFKASATTSFLFSLLCDASTWSIMASLWSRLALFPMLKIMKCWFNLIISSFLL